MLANLSNNLQKDFFLIHFNVRSLSKNEDKIQECLNDITRLPDALPSLKLNKILLVLQILIFLTTIFFITILLLWPVGLEYT